MTGFNHMKIQQPLHQSGSSGAIASLDFGKVEIQHKSIFVILFEMKAFSTKTVQNIAFSTTQFKILKEALFCHANAPQFDHPSTTVFQERD